MTMENMDGDYFVVGTELVDGTGDLWKEIQAGLLWSLLLIEKNWSHSSFILTSVCHVSLTRLSPLTPWSCGQTGLWGTLKGRLERMLHPNKRLGGLPKNISVFCNLVCFIKQPLIASLPSPPCQKLAQRDQSGMQELLQICCLMNYVWPKVQNHIGKGKLLDDIMDQWKLGCLG